MRLTRQLTAGITIPFIGEPLDGLQVMGVLETRGLDFENLIITSFNEGIFPAKSSSNSFIPYNLRRGFELPTTEYQDAITAYNFYRLIHRAKRIFFIYDSRTEGMQTGEVSRFMHQLYYHYGVKAKEKAISFDIGFENPGFIEIKKSQAVMEKLEQFCSTGERVKAFSASSLNSYIDCPLQFYLTRVETVEEADEVMETVEASMFGSLFHKVMENLYAPYKGKILKSETLDQILSRTLLIDDEILRAFNTEFFKRKPDQNLLALEGNNLLIASVLRKYIIQVLKTDKKYTPFKYVAAEERCSMQFPIQGGSRQINIKGFVDRIDEKEGRLRILDYKTGSGKLDFKNLEEVFEHNKDQRPKFVLQTFLYCLLYEQLTGSKNTTPGIFYIRDVFKEEFDTHLNNKELKEKVTAFDDYRDSFIENLSKCLEEIFNPDIPFTQTTNTKVCQYCSYVGVCNR
jgi:ATP-dependent helicase/DNAse subunit B